MVSDLFDKKLLHKIIHTQSILGQADFNFDVFIQLVVDEMQHLTPATGAVVELAEGKEMVYRAVTGSVAGHLGLRLKMANSISGLCVSTSEILCANDTETDQRVNVEACRKINARSLVVAPLIHTGNPIGVLKIVSNKANAFSKIDIQTLQIMAGFIATGVANQLFYRTKDRMLQERALIIKKLQKVQDRLRRMAHHDALTGLPNRSLLSERLKAALSKAKRYKRSLALLYLDIDHFKTINDTLGHDSGDKLLKGFGGRLKRSVRNYDLVARLGGDEFIILIEELKQQDDAINIALKILENTRKEFKLQDKTAHITTSIGLTFCDGESIQPLELIKQADKAMYAAKEGGRNQLRIHGHK